MTLRALMWKQMHTLLPMFSHSFYVSLCVPRFPFLLIANSVMLSFDVYHMDDYHKVIRGLLSKHTQWLYLPFSLLKGAQNICELINIGPALLLFLCLIYHSSWQWFVIWQLPCVPQPMMVPEASTTQYRKASSQRTHIVLAEQIWIVCSFN